MDDSRVTITGTVELLQGADGKAARELYRQRHPDSFWIDFGDFEPFRMTSISKVRLNGGFARAATVSILVVEQSRLIFVASRMQSLTMPCGPSEFEAPHAAAFDVDL